MLKNLSIPLTNFTTTDVAKFIFIFILQDKQIDDTKLITKVWDTNKRGVKRKMLKLVCPFCFSLLAPQRRPGTGRQGASRWDVTNFGRHLSNACKAKTWK